MVHARRRKGWIRLGIICSIAWLIGVLVFAGIEYHTVQADLTLSVQFVDPLLTAGKWEVVGKQTFITNCGVNEKQVSCSPRFANLALLAIGPVALGWVLVVLIVYAVIWVHAGFRGDET